MNNYLVQSALLAASKTPIETETWHWLAFGAFVVIMLTLDLTVFHRKAHEPSLRESAWWTVFWCSLALAFNGLIWVEWGRDHATDFLSGYLTEWSLSMDNVFVFAVVFSYFRVPLKYQYRVLFWGILGAIIMRLSFILLGAALLEHFKWMFLVFGGFLIYTGIKLAFKGDEEVHPENNILIRLGKKVFTVAKGSHGDSFFVVENGKRCVTPLFLVLLVIESTDVVFAIDSVPAIFAITREPFLVFTSNIFAIMGLRALYFLLAGVMDMFRYLNYGLSAVLVYVGCKMMAEYVLHTEQFAEWTGITRFLPVIDPAFPDAEPHAEHLIASPVNLLIIITLLGTSIAASIIAQKRDAARGIVHEGHEPKADGE
ncbi:MAG: TerC family protein [Planctomycetota bacterium]|nr:TerC family protein [Planctomycetota bacterium]